jgi:hypothetical protein
MANPPVRRVLKARLAALASEQRKAKRARKRLAEAEFAALRRELTGQDDPTWSAQRDVQERRVEITACLNLYHEFRGSPHRHGIEKGWEWHYSRVLSRLREELASME